MKRMVSVEEVEGEGLLRYMGEKVLLLCANYFYTGKLVGVNDTCVMLEEPRLVYDTGAWSTKDYTDAQSLPSPWYVQVSAVESFGASK